MEKQITINYPISAETAKHLSVFFNGTLTSQFGEHTVKFDNDYGKGSILVLPCGDGLCHMHFEVLFSKSITFIIVYHDIVPIDFMFLTTGNLTFEADKQKPFLIQSYQNVIVKYEKGLPISYLLESEKLLRINIIQICSEAYLKRNHRFVELMEHNFKDIFLASDETKFYHHFGNLNLKIADYIRQLNHCGHDGMIRALMMEAYVNMILALQLTEYENFNKDLSLPKSLTIDDLKKAQRAAELIHESIHQIPPVRKLARAVQLTDSKLQSGFKFLYQKTVNNYIREVKLQEAHNYFMDTDLTVSEVVYKIGYTSRSYFTQIFYERFGILPNEYRKSSK